MPAVVSCSAGHELKRVKVTAEVVAECGDTSCDPCGKRIRLGVHSMHCAECIFDLRPHASARSARASLDASAM